MWRGMGKWGRSRGGAQTALSPARAEDHAARDSSRSGPGEGEPSFRHPDLDTVVAGMELDGDERVGLVCLNYGGPTKLMF
jgi:hypothetical protein